MSEGSTTPRGGIGGSSVRDALLSPAQQRRAEKAGAKAEAKAEKAKSEAEARAEKERKKREQADRKRLEKDGGRSTSVADPASGSSSSRQSSAAATTPADGLRPVKFSSSANLRRTATANSIQAAAAAVDDSWVTSDEIFCMLVGSEHAGKTKLLATLSAAFDIEALFGSVALELPVRGGGGGHGSQTLASSSASVESSASGDAEGGAKIRVNVVDSEASDAFSRLRALHYEIADGIVLCYSLYSSEHIEDVLTWYFPEVSLIASGKPLFLLGLYDGSRGGGAADADGGQKKKKKKKSKEDALQQVPAESVRKIADEIEPVFTRTIDVTQKAAAMECFQAVVDAVIEWRQNK